MERYVYIGEKEMCKTSFPKNGVFWIIEGKLLAFAFEEEIYPEGIAKSGTTYNHKKLWKAVHPKGCGEPYNYYPRGRVHITKDGTAHLFFEPSYNSRVCAGNQSLLWYKRRYENTL